MRHTEAVPLGGAITRDADRPLSGRGEDDAELMGSALAHLDPNIDIVIASPLRRAQQTGEILSTGLSDKPIWHTSNNLAPGFLPRNLLEELIAFTAGASVVAVGHQPDLGMFISFLVAESAPATIELGPGAVARITVSGNLKRPKARLNWILTPEVVRSMYLQS
ncbi:MAG: histidine phosphatase family protein [Ignavibacteria bacterium]|nr:histidine phosphatase family protein [Ignavibacteria bacterium]